MIFGDSRLPEYFWKKHHVQEDGCWVPSVAITHRTGRLSVYIPKFHRNTRYNYRHTAHVAYGPLPAGLGVSHLCHNKTCCNPAHLTYESNAKNAARERKYAAPLDMPSKEYEKLRHREDYKANPEKIRERSSKWYYANREQVLKKWREQYKAKKAVRGDSAQPKKEIN